MKVYGSATAEAGKAFMHLYENPRWVEAVTNVYENPTYLIRYPNKDTVRLMQFRDRACADEFFEEFDGCEILWGDD